MEEEELKDLSVDVKEWFLDQIEIDCDCMDVESEVEGDDDTDVVITVGYHSKEWSVANPDGKMFETETALEEYLKEKIAADLEDAFGMAVDLVPTGSLDSKFLQSISDDEVLLYEAS